MSSVLISHMGQMLKRFKAENGTLPDTLAVGRWDMREIAQAAAEVVRPRGTALDLLREAKNSGAFLFGVPIKVDFSIGRMPGALWWQADRRRLH